MIKLCIFLLTVSQGCIVAYTNLVPLKQELIYIEKARKEKKKKLALLRIQLEKVKRTKEHMNNTTQKD